MHCLQAIAPWRRKVQPARKAPPVPMVYKELPVSKVPLELTA
jgi:hypothetical protein